MSESLEIYNIEYESITDYHILFHIPKYSSEIKLKCFYFVLTI